MAVSADNLAAMLTTSLFGHTAQEAQLAEAVSQGRLPSAYLFTGAKGIGKTSMALRLAAALLAGKAEEEDGSMNLFGDALPVNAPLMLHIDMEASALKRMIQRSHSDFLLLQPEYDATKQAFKRDIVIEQTRKIGSFLSRTAAEGIWRVIIIDPADVMTEGAANALLKWLEEPPPYSIFILISHATGKLLPTIRSRCRKLAFTPPTYDTFVRVLELDADAPTTRQLHRFTAGSLGLAYHWQNMRWSEHWQGILSFLLAQSKQQPALITQLSDAIVKDTAFGIANMQRLLDSLMLRVTLYQQTGIMDVDTPDETRAIEKLAAQRTLHHWLTLWHKQRNLYINANTLYLDKRYVIIGLLSDVVQS